MISSTSLRLLQKTCGLFDTGLAGDAEHITSIAQIAPTDVLTDFDLGGYDSSINFTNPNDFSNLDNGVIGSLAKNSDGQSLTAQDTDNWDLLDDLSGDPLGDESLDAFINLDKYLNGNSFFDEDGNFVQESEEVKPVIDLPTIENIDQNFPEVVQNLTDSVSNPVTMVESLPIEVLSVPETSAVVTQPTRKRKRKATSTGGVKTSLFEIPESADNQLDHDYSTKAKNPKLTDKSEPSVVNKNTTTKNKNKETVSMTDAESKDSELNDSSNIDKQTMRRLKNNVASKRSREQRKQKFVDMDKEAEELIFKNDELRKKIVELEKLASEMKAILVSKMAGK